MLNLETLIQKATPNIREFIFQLRNFILDFSDEVEEKTTDKMICYRFPVLGRANTITTKRVRGVFWFNLTNGKILRVHMRKLGNYPNDYNKIVTEGWGGYPELTFKEPELNEDILKYLKNVIEHAFNGEFMIDHKIEDVEDVEDVEKRIFFDKNIEDFNKRISYQPSNPTVQTLYENYKDGDLILAPDFQRNYVWNKNKASNLIESIILNIPF